MTTLTPTAPRRSTKTAVDTRVPVEEILNQNGFRLGGKLTVPTHEFGENAGENTEDDQSDHVAECRGKRSSDIV